MKSCGDRHKDQVSRGKVISAGEITTTDSRTTYPNYTPDSKDKESEHV